MPLKVDASGADNENPGSTPPAATMSTRERRRLKAAMKIARAASETTDPAPPARTESEPQRYPQPGRMIGIGVGPPTPAASLPPPPQPPRPFTASPLGKQAGSRRFPQEVDESGNVEYKLRLIGVSPERLEHLRTQMKWRVEEGGGCAVYRVGVMNNGDAVGIPENELQETLETLRACAEPLGYDASVLEKFEGALGWCACVSIARKPASRALVGAALCSPTLGLAHHSVQHEVRVAVVGAFTSGKSSIVAVLTRGVFDDGKGRAGRAVAVHKHEIRFGRTYASTSHVVPPRRAASFSSSLTLTTNATMMMMMGTPAVTSHIENVFSELDLNHHNDDDDDHHHHHAHLHPHPHPHPHHRHHHGDNPRTFPNKVVSLVDTGGHPKSLTSCLRGICASRPHRFMIVVDIETLRVRRARNGGMTTTGAGPMTTVGVTERFVQLVQELGVPYFFVVNKVETQPHDASEWVRELEDLARCGVALVAEAGSMANLTVNVIPAFFVSAVTGLGMDELGRYLHSLEAPEVSTSSSSSSLPATKSVLGIVRQFAVAPTAAAAASASATSTAMAGASLFGAMDDDDDKDAVQSPNQVVMVDRKLIVTGIVRTGAFHVHQHVCVGPDHATGRFFGAEIASMRCATDSWVSCAPQDTTGCLCLELDETTELEARKLNFKGGVVVADDGDTDDAERAPANPLVVRISFGATPSALPRVNEEVVVFLGAAALAARVVSVPDQPAGSCEVQFVHPRRSAWFHAKEHAVIVKRSSGQVMVGSCCMLDEHR